MNGIKDDYRDAVNDNIMIMMQAVKTGIPDEHDDWSSIEDHLYVQQHPLTFKHLYKKMYFVQI